MCHSPAGSFAPNETKIRTEKTMVRVSAWPTIDWLSRTGDAAKMNVDLATDPVAETSSCLERLSGWLARWSRTGVEIQSDIWIRTPNGEEYVDLMFIHRGRRIGVRFTGRYERETSERDAIVLVYGRFDSLYRIRGGGSKRGMIDAAYLLVSLYPTCFTVAGRFEAGRMASDEAVLSGSELSERGWIGLDSVHIQRSRLSRANDWVRAFESGLSRPAIRGRSRIQPPTADASTVRPSRTRETSR